MSAHRQHYTPAPAPVNRPHLHFTLAAFAIAAAMMIGLGISLVINGTPRDGTPVATPQAITTALPAADTAIVLHGRLIDWRAGYEAALDNGCRPQPRRATPLGLQP